MIQPSKIGVAWDFELIYDRKVGANNCNNLVYVTYSITNDS